MRNKEGQGGRRDEEKGWTRRKDGLGGRSDEEGEKKVLKKKIKKWREDGLVQLRATYLNSITLSCHQLVTADVMALWGSSSER